MIQITQVETEDRTQYDFIRCPVCRGRLCDKPHGTAVSVLQIHGSMKADHVLVKCHKCGARYLVTVTE